MVAYSNPGRRGATAYEGTEVIKTRPEQGKVRGTSVEMERAVSVLNAVWELLAAVKSFWC